jgi:hypothetical protein
MKRLNILIMLLMIFGCGNIYAAGKNSDIPTQEQVQKLVTAAWKEPIESIDITFYKDYTKVSEPVEQIRKRAEEFADRGFKGRSVNELKSYEIERRNKIIERNFKDWVENQKFPRKIKSWVRISGNNQRIDFVKVGPNEPLGPDTPFVHTFINAKDANTGNFVSYHYAGDMNTAFVDTTKWTKETITQFVGIPIAGGLQAFLGINQGSLTSPIFVPDQNKVDELAITGLATIESIGGVKAEKPGVNRISIYPDPNAPRLKDIIEMGDPNYFPTAVLVCDKEDYSRVYRTEYHIPTTNKLIYRRECDNFDSNGFPHNITETKYDKDGNFVEKSVYKIIKVKPNPSIAAKIFELNPPQGYKVEDRRLKQP